MNISLKLTLVQLEEKFKDGDYSSPKTALQKKLRKVDEYGTE